MPSPVRGGCFRRALGPARVAPHVGSAARERLSFGTLALVAGKASAARFLFFQHISQ